MKLSDYLVEYFYKIGVTDYFGYQGTMIAHFIDSIGKNHKVKNHVCYNEQGAAFEAVGYAKSTGKNVCAYSTSGPGATNLITGIADAYYDSVPVIFITGQLNTYEYSNIKTLRQQGFQETDIVSIIKPITMNGVAYYIFSLCQRRYKTSVSFHSWRRTRQSPNLQNFSSFRQIGCGELSGKFSYFLVVCTDEGCITVCIDTTVCNDSRYSGSICLFNYFDKRF